jgi:hypothetical protein
MRYLTRRGWIVLVILPAIAFIALMVWVSGHVWYVPTTTGGYYCIDTMVNCYAEAFTR